MAGQRIVRKVLGKPKRVALRVRGFAGRKITAAKTKIESKKKLNALYQRLVKNPKILIETRLDAETVNKLVAIAGIGAVSKAADWFDPSDFNRFVKAAGPENAATLLKITKTKKFCEFASPAFYGQVDKGVVPSQAGGILKAAGPFVVKRIIMTLSADEIHKTLLRKEGPRTTLLLLQTQMYNKRRAQAR